MLAPLLMIRREHWKYIWSEIDPPMLFDLDSDPMETCNLAGSPEVSAVEAAFADEVKHKWDIEALHRAVVSSQQRRRFVQAALSKGQRNDWTGPLPLTGQSAYCSDDLGYYDWTAAGTLP